MWGQIGVWGERTFFYFSAWSVQIWVGVLFWRACARHKTTCFASSSRSQHRHRQRVLPFGHWRPVVVFETFVRRSVFYDGHLAVCPRSALLPISGGCILCWWVASLCRPSTRMGLV